MRAIGRFNMSRITKCKTTKCIAVLVFVIGALLWLQSRRNGGGLGGRLGGGGVRPYEGFSEIRSEKDIEAGSKCMSKSGKDQIMFFFMNGCPHCDKIMPKWSEYKASLGNGDPEPREFEVSAAPNACREYDVTGFPNFVLADSDGNVKSRDRPF